MALPSTLKIGAGTPNLVTGGVLAAPLGTALPTNETTALNAAFKALGYVSEDGLEPQGERTVNTVKDWSTNVIAQLQTEHSSRFSLTLLAGWDSDVLTELYGASNVTVTAATSSSGTKIKVTENGAVLPFRSWIFDMAQDAKKLRLVLPNAKITEASERPFVAGDLTGYQITVEAFPDATGVKVIRYYDDGVFSA
ncbi:phage tail tube protein [Nocardia sp. CY41]|uniref:phage tail tube protein n=1 Tax=Nocardia sp. CY41 TaxID=2608686 RepID=UPI001356BD79|nr:phage tail protein [Nocardia sp. CY41]